MWYIYKQENNIESALYIFLFTLWILNSLVCNSLFVLRYDQHVNKKTLRRKFHVVIYILLFFSLYAVHVCSTFTYTYVYSPASTWQRKTKDCFKTCSSKNGNASQQERTGEYYSIKVSVLGWLIRETSGRLWINQIARFPYSDLTSSWRRHIIKRITELLLILFKPKPFIRVKKKNCEICRA